MQRKAVSALISTVLVLALVFGLAAIISPWLFNITTGVTNQTSTSVNNQITCQAAKYDFDTAFATHGINFNLSGPNDVIEVKVVNTGTVNLYSFSLEIQLNASAGIDIKQLTINQTSQKTEALPLKPGQSAILKANMTQDFNGTLQEVKILNGVCPSNFVRQSV